MDHLFEICHKFADTSDILCIYKYVDDIIIGTTDSIRKTKTHLESEAKKDKDKYNEPGLIEITIEYENIFRSLSYLEVTLTRSLENHIITNWCKKDIASDRIINYLSNHPIKMKTKVQYHELHNIPSKNIQRIHKELRNQDLASQIRINNKNNIRLNRQKSLPLTTPHSLTSSTTPPQCSHVYIPINMNNQDP